MPAVVIVGAQWGDEGKGKVVDVLTENADAVARYQGGPNAGHTIVYGGREIVLHSVPSGIVHGCEYNVVGNGCVVDLSVLTKELYELEHLGINTDGMRISERAHVITPYHKEIDRLSETSKGIGTTGRGIGPAYTDKARRTGIRLYDLHDEKRARELVEAAYERFLIELNNGDRRKAELDVSLRPPCVTADLLRLFGEVAQRTTDTSDLLVNLLAQGKKVLLEGAQGTILDMDHGTYPNVTSSSTTVGGALSGSGIPLREVKKVIGVLKAYATRVGNGPFPTELVNPGLKNEKKLPLDSPEFFELRDRVLRGNTTDAEKGRYIRAVGNEYGATTGRPRRTGWEDLVAARYAAKINGFDFVAITKLDVLDRLPEIRVCDFYHDGTGRICQSSMPPGLEKWKPDYATRHGWHADISDIRNYGELPREAREYLESFGLKIGIVSVGPDREQTIMLESVW